MLIEHKLTINDL